MDKMTKQFTAWLGTPTGLTFSRVFGNILKGCFIWVIAKCPWVITTLGIAGVKPETVAEYAVPVAILIVSGIAWVQARFNNKRIKRALMTTPPKRGLATSDSRLPVGERDGEGESERGRPTSDSRLPMGGDGKTDSGQSVMGIVIWFCAVIFLVIGAICFVSGCTTANVTVNLCGPCGTNAVARESWGGATNRASAEAAGSVAVNVGIYNSKTVNPDVKASMTQ